MSEWLNSNQIVDVSRLAGFVSMAYAAETADFDYIAGIAVYSDPDYSAGDGGIVYHGYNQRITRMIGSEQNAFLNGTEADTQPGWRNHRPHLVGIHDLHPGLHGSESHQ